MTAVTIGFTWAMVKLTYVHASTDSDVPYGPVVSVTAGVLLGMVLLEVGGGIVAVLDYVWFNLPV